MPLYFGGSSPLNGGTGNDYLVGWAGSGGTTMNAGDGNDVVLGDIGYFNSATAGVANNSTAAAMDLEAALTWTTSFNELALADGTTPHTSVYVEATAGQTEYFSVSVGAGETLTVDLDFGRSAPGSSVDTEIEIYDASGTLVATIDDSVTDSQPADGSFSNLDPFLSYTALTGGTYFIRIGRYLGSAGVNNFNGGETFWLTTSVTGHATGQTVSTGDDVINGDNGNDALYGMAGNDTLNGGLGNDQLSGGFSIDSVNGGDGDDIIYFGNGEFIDNVDGGIGTDTLDASAISSTGVALTADLLAGTLTGLGGPTSIAGVENITGSQGGDNLTGSASANVIDGQGGNDTIAGSFGVDTIDGGAGDDTIIQNDGEFRDNVSGGSGVDTLNASTVVSAGEEISVDWTAGSWNGFGGVLTFSGIETVIGTQLSDTFALGSGTETVDGQGGDDTFAHGNGEWIDNVAGGGGVDTLNLSDVVNADEGVTINGDVDSWTGFGGTRTITGFEIIRGTQLNDVIRYDDALSDTIYGEGGDDTLQGGFNTDSIFGGDGDDLIQNLNGEFLDNVDGGAGTDTLDLSTQANDVDGDTFDFGAGVITTNFANSSTLTVAGIEIYRDGSGSNTIISSGTMTIYANGGNDTVWAGIGNSETLDGGSGVDTLNTSFWGGDYVIDLATGVTNYADSFTNFERLISGAGNDTLSGSAAANIIYGGIGNDLVSGVDGSDRLYGEAGNDTLIGGTGNDTLAGGIGNDTADYSAATAAVTVTLGTTGNQNTGGAGIDKLSGIENLVGSSFSDTLIGNGAANVLTGGGGNDSLTAFNGDDVLNGDAGSDQLLGGNGADTLNGDIGNDTLNGQGGIDTMNGGSGDDSYYVDTVGDAVVEVAGAGTDTVRTSIDYTLAANVERLFLLGLARNGTGNVLDNVIQGSTGADTLQGLGGNDTIRGNNGTDALSGGAGNDTLFGGALRDTLTGGTGVDGFRFETLADSSATLAQSDRITDFSKAEGDRIYLNLIDANSAAAGDQAFAFIGTGAFTGVAGQLRYSISGPDTVVQADVNGDTIVDMYIRLTGSIALAASDFAL